MLIAGLLLSLLSLNFKDMSKINEIWKPTSYTNYYASDLGRVKSINRKDVIGREVNGRIISPLNHNTGYHFIWIFNDGKRIKQYIHRLVLTAFLPNHENKPTVNHKNGIKTDNRVENLEWATWREQLIHAYNTKLMIAPKGEKSVRHKKLAQYDLGGNLIKVWNGVRACARELGVHYTQITAVTSGKRNSFNKCKWKYIK